VSTAPPQANAGHERKVATGRLVGLLVLTSAAALAYATNWDSPIRALLVLGFLLFGPGLAVAELLEIREPMRQLAIAAGASLAVETLIGLALLYAGVFSAGLVFAIIVAVTIAAAAIATLRLRRSTISIVDSPPFRASA
jgi:uncharacterized membrane protein